VDHGVGAPSRCSSSPRVGPGRVEEAVASTGHDPPSSPNTAGPYRPLGGATGRSPARGAAVKSFFSCKIYRADAALLRG
jgi:hypothetical protein